MHDWLITEEAQDWLSRLRGETLSPMLAALLRKDMPAEKVAPILEQLELRDRGLRKFTRSGEMLFTRIGLEQATDEWIADYKAKRFCNAKKVVDVCSGIGGDLIGLAKNGVSSIGIDRDPASATFSLHNSKIYGGSVSVACEEACENRIKESDAWHADPDRRVSGRRSINPSFHEPTLEQLTTWRAITPNAAVKLAPATRLPEAWQQECELEWISRENECKQLVAWSGELTSKQGLRKATKVHQSGDSFSFAGNPDEPIELSDMIEEYIYEPDSSVIAAHLIGSLSIQFSLSQVSASKAYLTSVSLVIHPLLKAFKVEGIFPFQRKILASECHLRQIGRLELKSRGLDINLMSLRKKLRLKGSNSGTLVLTPDAKNPKKPIAILCNRIAQ